MAALHQETLVCSAPKRRGSCGMVLVVGLGVDVREDWKFTGWAVVVAGQDGTLVVTQALPVVVLTVADSDTSGGKAVCDDAVGVVRECTLCD